jgi:WD40 repeat protein
VCFSHDGKRVVSGSEDKTFSVIDCCIYKKLI